MPYLPRIPFLFVSLLFWFLYGFHFKRTFGLCSTHEMWKDFGLLEQEIESFGPVVILDTRSICSFICCWYRFLSYIQVVFSSPLCNAKFEFSTFSIPMTHCLFLKYKSKICRATINESSILAYSILTFGFFWKKEVQYTLDLRKPDLRKIVGVSCLI